MRIVSQTYNNSRDLHLVLRKDRHREVKFLASESQQALGEHWGGEGRFKSTWLAWAHMLPTWLHCSLKFTEDWSVAPPGNRTGPLWLWNTVKEEKVLQHRQGSLERTPTSICSVCRYYHSPLVPLLPHHHHHCSLLNTITTTTHHHHCPWAAHSGDLAGLRDLNFGPSIFGT